MYFWYEQLLLDVTFCYSYFCNDFLLRSGTTNSGQASVSMSPALAKANDLAEQHNLRLEMLQSRMSCSRDLVCWLLFKMATAML